MNKKSDILEYDVILNKAKKLLLDNQKFIIGFYLILSINTGCRIGQILKLRHQDLKGDVIIIKENNTVRRITLNKIVKNAYKKLIRKLNEINFKYDEKDFIFVSQKGTVYRPQSINKILKQLFSAYSKNLNISSLSLTKSYGRKVWDNMNQSDYSLQLLSREFSHNSIASTRAFLGIPKVESDIDLYLILEK